MWMWGILGLVLLAVEMMIGTMDILWFGIAALIVATLVWLMPEMSVPIQLFLYAFFALGALFIWRYFYKQSDVNPRIGQSQGDEIGKTGIILHEVTPQQTGKIQFTQGIMGSREWPAASDETIEAGTLAEIVAIEGNTLRVVKKAV